MIYVFDKESGELFPKPERSKKLKMSDSERAQQRQGHFRESDNEGRSDPQDGIRQGPGVYSGR